MDLQVVLIDFGQAVDVRHPEAQSFLERDIARVRSFFTKHGVETLSLQESLLFVVNEQNLVATDCDDIPDKVARALEAQS